MSKNKVNCIIKKALDPKKLTWADIHITKLEGKTKITRRVTYENTTNGEQYSYLAGGFMWPWKRSPGFAVVLAVLKGDDDKKSIFKTVDEAEEHDVFALMERCQELSEKWGYEQDGEIMHLWWGDYERFWSLAGEMHQTQEQGRGKKAIENGFFIAPPIELDKSNAFEVYLRRIASLIRTEKKRLHFGKCERLRGYMRELPPDASKYQCQDFPPIAALGFVLHSMCIIQPWRRDLQEVANEMGMDIRVLATTERDEFMRQLQDISAISLFIFFEA